MNSYASNYARVAEQADAPDLKFGVRKNVRVQVPSRVLSDTTLKPTRQKSGPERSHRSIRQFSHLGKTALVP